MIKIKKTLLISLLLICFFSLNGVSQKVNAFDEQGKRHGNWKKYYSNGRLRYTGNFKHGKEVGVFLYFSMVSSKQPTIIKIFSENTDIAKVEYFTPKGDVRSRGKMKGKKRIGKWTYFFSSGKLFSEEFYTDGKLNGVLKNYYPNGKITEETMYKEGLKNGISKKYSDQGILLEKITYANGKMNGLAMFYDNKGNIKEQGNYKNGVRVGNWEFYSNEGVLSAKGKRKKNTHIIKLKDTLK